MGDESIQEEGVRIAGNLARRACRRALAPVFRASWRVFNNHNDTRMQGFFERSKVQVGTGTYGRLDISFFGTPNEKVTIGRYCSIASGVRFVCGGEHRLDTLSTYPFERRYFGAVQALCKGPIVVEDDVWIGTNAVVLSGVTVGRGAVVAAGAVVTQSVPPYAIAGGVPAKVIKYRFADDLICRLESFDYRKVDEVFVARFREALAEPLSAKQLDEMIAFQQERDECASNTSKPSS